MFASAVFLFQRNSIPSPAILSFSVSDCWVSSLQHRILGRAGPRCRQVPPRLPAQDPDTDSLPVYCKTPNMNVWMSEAEMLFRFCKEGIFWSEKIYTGTSCKSSRRQNYIFWGFSGRLLVTFAGLTALANNHWANISLWTGQMLNHLTTNETSVTPISEFLHFSFCLH